MRKRCRRKLRPVGHVLTPGQVSQLTMPIHMALELLPLGLFSENHAHDLAAYLSVAQVAAEDAGRDDLIEVAGRGALAVVAMRDRVRAGATWIATSAERNTLLEAVLAVDKFFRTQSSARWCIALRKVYAACDEARARGLQELDLIEEVACLP